jgi:hypothetical protein
MKWYSSTQDFISRTDFSLSTIRGHGKGQLFPVLNVQIAHLRGKHMGPFSQLHFFSRKQSLKRTIFSHKSISHLWQKTQPAP